MGGVDSERCGVFRLAAWVKTDGQLEFSGWGDVVPFPGAKKKRRRRCPCRDLVEKTDLLAVAMDQLDDAGLDLLEARLAWLRRARELEIS